MQPKMQPLPCPLSLECLTTFPSIPQSPPKTTPQRSRKLPEPGIRRVYSFESLTERPGPSIAPSFSRHMSLTEKISDSRSGKQPFTSTPEVPVFEAATEKGPNLYQVLSLPDPLLFQIADSLLLSKNRLCLDEISTLFHTVSGVSIALRTNPAWRQNIIQKFLIAKPGRINSILGLAKGNLLSIPPIWLRVIHTIGPWIKRISCRECDFTPENTLSMAACFTNLQRFELSHSTITNASLGILGMLFKASLTHLHFTTCTGFTNRGTTFLRAFTKLESIAFVYCEGLSDRTARNIGQIKTLSAVNLAGARQITDNGLYHLASLPALTELDLSCQILITDRGLSYFTINPTLHKLTVTFCKNLFKGNPGYMRRFQHLEEIVLRRLPAFNRALLQCFPKMHELKSVDLTANSLKQDVKGEIDALTQRMDQLTISYKK